MKGLAGYWATFPLQVPEQNPRNVVFPGFDPSLDHVEERDDTLDDPPVGASVEGRGAGDGCILVCDAR